MSNKTQNTEKKIKDKDMGFLKITRHVNKSLEIGDNIKIVISDFTPENGVELSITAPKNLKIIRRN